MQFVLPASDLLYQGLELHLDLKPKKSPQLSFNCGLCVLRGKIVKAFDKQLRKLQLSNLLSFVLQLPS